MKKHTEIKKEPIILVPMREQDVLCLWAAVVLREPEPLTRLLKKILKPVVMKRLRTK